MNIVPAVPGTVAIVTRVPGDPPTEHAVPAWAWVGDRVVAMIHVNNTGELVPASRLRQTVEHVVVVQR